MLSQAPLTYLPQGQKHTENVDYRLVGMYMSEFKSLIWAVVIVMSAMLHLTFDCCVCGTLWFS